MAKWMVNIIVAIGRALDGGFIDAYSLEQVVNSVLEAYEVTERFVLRSTLEAERTFVQTLREQVDELNKKVNRILERALIAERKNEYYFGGSKEFKVRGMFNPNFIAGVRVLRAINPDLPMRRTVVIAETLAGLVNELGKKGHSASDLSGALAYAIGLGSGATFTGLQELTTRESRLRWGSEFCPQADDTTVASKHVYNPDTKACDGCGAKAYNHLDI